MPQNKMWMTVLTLVSSALAAQPAAHDAAARAAAGTAGAYRTQFCVRIAELSGHRIRRQDAGLEIVAGELAPLGGEN